MSRIPVENINKNSLSRGQLSHTDKTMIQLTDTSCLQLPVTNVPNKSTDTHHPLHRLSDVFLKNPLNELKYVVYAI